MTKLLKNLGPGILYAGAAVGVSHLVQSTKAGALFGWQLIPFILLINLLKYPFFKVGSSYVSITNKDLLDGYKEQGKLAYSIIFLQTLATMFIVIAAIVLVTSGIMPLLFPSFSMDLKTSIWINFTILLLVLWFGKYDLLQKLVKWIIIGLSISSIIVAISGGVFYEKPLNTPVFSFENSSNLMFLIALLGWLPAPMDVSIWQSLWAKEGKKKNLKDALKDFKIGYLTTVILSLVFVFIGTFTLYGSGVILSEKAIGFAKQLIDMYTMHIGNWAYFIIALAAFLTMFSTSLTVTDAYPRVIAKMISGSTQKFEITFKLVLLFTIIISYIIIEFFTSNMSQLVNFITSVSFALTPVICFLNYKLITGKDVELEKQPKKKEKGFMIISLILLTTFTLISFTLIL